jgi:hypothetical protein
MPLFLAGCVSLPKARRREGLLSPPIGQSARAVYVVWARDKYSVCDDDARIRTARRPCPESIHLQLTELFRQPKVALMRCFFLVLLLALPATAIAANTAVDRTDIVETLRQDVQQLRAENQRLADRVEALEKRFPSQHQVLGITANFGNGALAKDSRRPPPADNTQ